MFYYRISLWDGKHFIPWVSLVAKTHTEARATAKELGAAGTILTHQL